MRLPAQLISALVFGLLTLTTLSTVYAASSDKEPRVLIHIYKYSGVHTPEALGHFSQFKDIIQAKVSLIAEELELHNSSFAQLAKLSPFFVADQQGQHVAFTGSNADLLTRWQRANALEIFLGRVRKVDQDYFVKSRIFFGKLSTQLASPFLSIELPLRDQQYDTTRDSHSAAILFALAMDSKARCRPGHETLALLSAAHEKLLDLTSELAGINQLKSAVEQNLAMSQECQGDSL